MSFHSGPLAPFAALALCVALAACNEPTSEAPPPRTALVVAVEPAPLMLAAEGSGTVEARTTTNVGFLVSGRMTTRDVDVGSTVNKGDPIAALDPTDLKNQVEAAQAQVAAAQAAVDQAAPEEAAKRDLLAKGFTTQSEYNQALKALQSAQADLGAAQANLRLAQDQLKYANLTAPVAGVVTKTGADPGQVVQAGQMIVEIADISALDAVFSVSQRIANMAKIGIPVLVWLQSDPTVKVEGKVRQISPNADPTTGTYTVRVGLDNPPSQIRIGSLVRGRAESTGEEVYSVPPTALVQTGDKPAVWVVTPDTNAVKLTPVTVVRFDTDAVLISDGLQKGDLVVIAGVNSLAEGQVVNPQKATPDEGA